MIVWDADGRAVLKANHGSGLLLVANDEAGTSLRWGGEGEDFILGLSAEERADLMAVLGAFDADDRTGKDTDYARHR